MCLFSRSIFFQDCLPQNEKELIPVSCWSLPEGASPGTAKDDPLVDTEVLAQTLNISDQGPGGVVLERCGRGRLAGAALVEQDDAVDLGVKVAAVVVTDTTTGPTVEIDHRLALGVAGLLVVEGVDVGDLEEALVVGNDLGVQFIRLWHDGIRDGGMRDGEMKKNEKAR